MNVGCSSPQTDGAVRLEYSVDHGVSWTPVVSQCSSVDQSLPSCTDVDLRPTTFYRDMFSHWQRVIVPLSGLHVCGCGFTYCHMLLCLCLAFTSLVSFTVTWQHLFVL